MYLKAGNRLVGHNFVSLDDIYPYQASKDDFSPGQPQNMARSAETPFQTAGNGYQRAGNRLVGHNFVSLDDIYPYLASKYDFRPNPAPRNPNQLKSAEIS